ncbi:ATP-binding cassette domain-containing protein [Streptomyces sp. M10(2022)]
MTTLTAARPARPVPAAEASGLNKQYPGVRALSDVDFRIEPGEVRALLGRNGAGKSTLIRMLSGVEVPDSGEVRIGGETLGHGGCAGRPSWVRPPSTRN